MNREERAKQFMPFDALKGLKEELYKRELKRLRVQKHTLTDENIENISYTLKRLKNGSKIEVVFYNNGYYIKVIENVKKIDYINKFIKTENNKIYFEDILDINLI